MDGLKKTETEMDAHLVLRPFQGTSKRLFLFFSRLGKPMPEDAKNADFMRLFWQFLWYNFKGL